MLQVGAGLGFPPRTDTSMLYIGIDVAKRELAIFDGESSFTVANTQAGVRRFLKSLDVPAAIALEATGGYGLLLAESAFEAGHEVFVLSPQQVSAYRKALGRRAKTDPEDARLLRDMLLSQRESLRPFKPAAEPYKTLLRLARARTALVDKAASIKLCLTDAGEDPKLALSGIRQAVAGLEGRIDALLAQAPGAALLATVPGVARATVAAVLPALATKEFRSKDAFVAYCGLDLRVADSGQKKGRRRISKNGDPHMRRALYMAAMAASRTKAWNPLYLRFKERLTGVAALNALARAIARTLYGMHKTGTAFNPELCLLDNRT